MRAGVSDGDEVGGAAFVAAAALIWGTLGIVERAFSSCGVSPARWAFLRAAFGSAASLAYYMIVRRPPDPRVILYGLALSGPLYLLYLGAVEASDAGTAAALLYTAPAMVPILGKIFLGEELTRAKAAAVILALAGVATIRSGPGEGLSARGLALGLGSGLAYAGVIAASRYLVDRAGLSPLEVGLGPLPWAALEAAAVEPGLPPTCSVLPGAYMGLATAALAYVLQAEGLRRIEASRAGVISTLEPATAAVLGILILGEPPSGRRLAGVALILAGAAAASAPGLTRRGSRISP